MIVNLPYPSLTELSSTRVAAHRKLFADILAAYRPDINTTTGAVANLVLVPRALLATATEHAISAAVSQTSSAQLVANPTATVDAYADAYAARYDVTRAAASKATGSVTIVLNALQPVVLTQGAVFVISGVSFQTLTPFTAVTTIGDVKEATDRLLVAVTGGYYAFTIEVEAVTAGSSGNIVAGVDATTNPALRGIVRSFSATAFGGGRNVETNGELLVRIRDGLSTAAWSSPSTIIAATRKQFARTAGAIARAGADIVLRGKRTLLPISQPGIYDYYVRTALLPITRDVAVTATLVSRVGSVGTWQATLDQNAAPGFYEIVSVRLPSQLAASGIIINSETRSFATSTLPTLSVAADAVFSSFQTAIIQFQDTITNASLLTVGAATQSYLVTASYLPNVKDIQTFWSDASRLPPGDNILVRAAVPCMVACSISITVPTGTAVSTTTLAAIKQAVSDATNNTGVGAVSLPGSLIVRAVQLALPIATIVQVTSLTGAVRGIDNVVTAISGDPLTVPSIIERGISPAVAAFYLAPAAITLTIV